MNGVAVVGAGHIGLPWASVLAANQNIDVTCIDTNEDRVSKINSCNAPFDEPQLEEYIEMGVENGKLSATTDLAAVANKRYVAFTINASKNDMSGFLNIIREYASYLHDEHVVINRTTLPVDVVGRMHSIIKEYAEGCPTFTTFPERLAEGKAIEEIESLPKIIGVDDPIGKDAMQHLLDGFECRIKFTDTETAMFVKLIDNSYRDSLFAIANQIGFTADELGLDAHDAISLANYDYPRNDIPKPGPVGGKCLPKDPHFLTDEYVCQQPTTPDLFTRSRRTNAFLPSYVVTQILSRQPSKVAMCGISYKKGIGDTFNSPAKKIADDLEMKGISVAIHDPYVETSEKLVSCLTDADVVVLAVNHPEFSNIETKINAAASDDVVVYDLWGDLEREAINGTYDGFGIRTR